MFAVDVDYASHEIRVVIKSDRRALHSCKRLGLLSASFVTLAALACYLAHNHICGFPLELEDTWHTMRIVYSDLEVVPNHASDPEVVKNDADAPEVAKGAEEKIAVQDDSNMRWIGQDLNQDSHGWTAMNGTGSHSTSRRKWRCCGIVLSRRSAYGLIAIVLLCIVAAAVGGGVGGSLSSSHSSSSSISTSTGLSSSTSSMPGDSASTISSSTTLATSATLTTSTIVVSPTETVYRDCPSSNNSIYTAQLSGGTAPILFRKACGYYFAIGPLTNSLPDVNVNQKSQSLDDCINLCIAQNTLNASAIANKEINPCNAVCWRNSSPGDEFPYNCFGGYSTNSTEGFSQSVNTICDSAAWMNQNVMA